MTYLCFLRKSKLSSSILNLLEYGEIIINACILDWLIEGFFTPKIKGKPFCRGSRGVYFQKFIPPLFVGLSLPRTEIRPKHDEGVIWAKNKNFSPTPLKNPFIDSLFGFIYQLSYLHQFVELQRISGAKETPSSWWLKKMNNIQ